MTNTIVELKAKIEEWENLSGQKQNEIARYVFSTSESELENCDKYQELIAELEAIENELFKLDEELNNLENDE